VGHSSSLGITWAACLFWQEKGRNRDRCKHAIGVGKGKKGNPHCTWKKREGGRSDSPRHGYSSGSSLKKEAFFYFKKARSVPAQKKRKEKTVCGNGEASSSNASMASADRGEKRGEVVGGVEVPL